jgi:fermentation-respiration switch protein FrsA (DUF1100 family)
MFCIPTTTRRNKGISREDHADEEDAGCVLFLGERQHKADRGKTRGRGYKPRAVNPNGGWNTTSDLGLLSMPILQYSDKIQSAVLMIHGEMTHSLYFGREAFSHLKGENKEFMLIPGASHTDLYDTDKIPFDKIEAFFRKYLG